MPQSFDIRYVTLPSGTLPSLLKSLLCGQNGLILDVTEFTLTYKLKRSKPPGLKPLGRDPWYHTEDRPYLNCSKYSSGDKNGTTKGSPEHDQFLIRASRTARAKRVSSNGTHDHTFRSLETFCQFPSDFFVSKSLISVRVSMLHFIFKRLSSQENVIWNCSAINILSYLVHVTLLANRKTFLKGFVEQNFLNRGHVASRFNLILSSPTVKQACTWPFHTFLDKLRNNLSI